VSYFWEKDREPHEITEIPKTDPRAWEKVYKRLLNPFGERDKELYLAMKRIDPDNPVRVLLTPIGRSAREYLLLRGAKRRRSNF